MKFSLDGPPGCDRQWPGEAHAHMLNAAGALDRALPNMQAARGTARRRMRQMSYAADRSCGLPLRRERRTPIDAQQTAVGPCGQKATHILQHASKASP